MRAAALALALALAASSNGVIGAASVELCPPDGTDPTALTVDDVVGLLEKWDLGFAFGQEFAQQRVNGFQLTHISKATVDPKAYPNAQPFHWAALWTRLDMCGLSTAARPSLQMQSNDRAEGGTVDRRRLSAASKSTNSSGISILNNQSAIIMGSNGDIELKRHANNVLGMDNHLRFCDDHGLQFCNTEGEDQTITSDNQGNLYVSGNVHFLSNVRRFAFCCVGGG